MPARFREGHCGGHWIGVRLWRSDRRRLGYLCGVTGSTSGRDGERNGIRDLRIRGHGEWIGGGIRTGDRHGGSGRVRVWLRDCNWHGIVHCEDDRHRQRRWHGLRQCGRRSDGERAQRPAQASQQGPGRRSTPPGSASGSGTSSGVGRAIIASRGAASGSGTASAAGITRVQSAGTASGAAAASGSSVAIVSTTGAASGSGTAYRGAECGASVAGSASGAGNASRRHAQHRLCHRYSHRALAAAKRTTLTVVGVAGPHLGRLPEHGRAPPSRPRRVRRLARQLRQVLASPSSRRSVRPLALLWRSVSVRTAPSKSSSQSARLRAQAPRPLKGRLTRPSSRSLSLARSTTNISLTGTFSDTIALTAALPERGPDGW